MSKKDWITSLLLDPPPMLPKTGFCCLKKSLATRKTHKVLQKQNHCKEKKAVLCENLSTISLKQKFDSYLSF